MIRERLAQNAALVDATLAEIFSKNDADFEAVLSAEKYSLFSRAKRIRPTLVLEFCRLFGGKDEAALPFAAAVEMVHTYSLIHDDLPAMDDDDLRRGRPSCHKAYDEATAILAGDALLTRAFGVLASNTFVSNRAVRSAVSALSRAAGDFGMIGGQIMDLAGEERVLTLKELRKLHANKTGAMIAVSAELGCLAAGLPSDDFRVISARRFAEEIGLAFQIVDDVLDATSDTQTLGKSVGSDQKEKKTTFLSYYSPGEAMTVASDLTQRAKEELKEIVGADVLLALADYLIRRTY